VLPAALLPWNSSTAVEKVMAQDHAHLWHEDAGLRSLLCAHVWSSNGSHALGAFHYRVRQLAGKVLDSRVPAASIDVVKPWKPRKSAL